MIALIWEYRVRDDWREMFEAAYASTGAWAQLFATAAGFKGTTLYKGAADSTYLTCDLWETRAHFDAFLASNRAAYEKLDRSTEGWTLHERKLGEFEVLD